MILKAGERLEDLQCNDLKIIQDENLYCFTSDSVVLANFIKTKESDFAVEIGTGSGVISILVNAKNKLKNITAFEIQKEMFDLAKRNIELNNLSNNIHIINDDIKNFQNYFSKESVDVVFSNPPYFKETKFKQNEIRQNCKEEKFLNCKELVFIANNMLKNGGTFFCCYSSDRSCELIEECQKNNLKIKEMFFTENGKGVVKLIVIKAVKGGKNGTKVYQNLETNEENGDYLDELKTKMFLKK